MVKEHPFYTEFVYYEQLKQRPTKEKGTLTLAFFTLLKDIAENKDLTNFAISYFEATIKPAVYLKKGLKKLEIVLGICRDAAGNSVLNGYVINTRDLQFEYFKYIDFEGHPQLKHHDEASKAVLGMAFLLLSRQRSDGARCKADTLRMEAFMHLMYFPHVQIGDEYVKQFRNRLLRQLLKG